MDKGTLVDTLESAMEGTVNNAKSFLNEEYIVNNPSDLQKKT